MGQYSIKTTPDEMDICVIGAMSPDEGLKYYQDFQREASKVNPATCKLVLDGSKLAVSSSDAAPVLSSVFKLYKDFGFENVVMKTGSNAILKMQCKSLAAKAGFTNFKME